MIAEIQPSFSSHKTLQRKVDYQLSKIATGDGKLLFSSTGDNLSSLPDYMKLIASLNDRVKLPYSEIILSLYPGEQLSDEQWISLTNDYVREMGYGQSCYAVILNTDKIHSHAHILLTTINEDGKSISSVNNYRRSDRISRDLERKYGLIPLEKGHVFHLSLGESQYRNYYFDSALKKAMRNHSTRDKVVQILSRMGNLFEGPVKDLILSNNEWQAILGEDIYNELFYLMTEKAFFNPLLKDELLQRLSTIYSFSDSTSSFRKNLNKDGLYMRLVTKKDKSYYIYGMKDPPFYLKDSSLPLKFRFGHLRFDILSMSVDEQKHFLYDHISIALADSLSYDDFKKSLANDSIVIMEHINTKGIYGLSFYIDSVSDPVTFKATEISREFSYRNIYMHYGSNFSESKFWNDTRFQERVKDEYSYMIGDRNTFVPELEITGSSKRHEDEDQESFKKKKKARKPDNDIHL